MQSGDSDAFPPRKLDTDLIVTVVGLQLSAEGTGRQEDIP